jgi:Helix-turn-helix domain
MSIESPAPLPIADVIESFGRMLTVEDLAPLLNSSPKTLYKRAKAGTMPVTRIGGSITFDPVLTAKWLRDQTA